MKEEIKSAFELIEDEIEMLLENFDINELREKQSKIRILEKNINDLYEAEIEAGRTELQHKKDQLEMELEEYQEVRQELKEIYDSLKNLTEMLKNEKIVKYKPGKTGKRGRKGNTNLEDYLLPVIELIKQGDEYKSAFHKIKEGLGVKYTTVSAQCTRQLGLNTEEFVSYVENGEILSLLKDKFPEKRELIEQELGIYYQ